jgi:hypothetical protein
MESKWQQYDLETLLVAILSGVASRPEAGHHLGPPYLTAYQLAIELQDQHPEVARALGYPLGGQGIGQQTSLAQYLGRELSRRIHTGEITQIEGALLSDLHLAEVSFKHDGAEIKSSLAGMGFDHALFRRAK